MPFKTNSASDSIPFRPGDNDDDEPRNIVQDLFKLESDIKWTANKTEPDASGFINFEPLQTERTTPLKPIIRDDENSPAYQEALRRTSALVSEKTERGGTKSFVVDERAIEKAGIVTDGSDTERSAFEAINRLQKPHINLQDLLHKLHEQKPHHNDLLPFTLPNSHIQLTPHKPHLLLTIPPLPHHGDTIHLEHLVPHKPPHGGGQDGHIHPVKPESHIVMHNGHIHLVKPEHQTVPHDGHTTPPKPTDGFAPSSDLKAASQRFDKACANLNPEQRAEFQRAKADMIEGCRERGLSEKEIKATLDQVTRLLETDSKVLNPKYEEKARTYAALGILQNAAQPDYYCNQGKHKTCNVTTVEERSFNNNPSRAAQIIADSIINGRFTSLDGKEIVLDPATIAPDAEARKTLMDGGNHRTYASQIFQGAVLSDLGSRNNPPVVYIANGGPGTSGEGWLNPATGEKTSFNGANNKEIEAMNHSVNGDHDVIKANFKTPAELEAWIAQNQAKQPLILNVDSKDPLFYNHTSSDGKVTRTNHVVTIREYDPVTHKVRVSNQWGSKSDFWVDIETLYQAT